MFAFLASALIVATAVQQIDTTVTVRPGSRLDLNNFEGSVTIGVWAKSAVRVQADPEDDEGDVDIDVSGSSVSIRSSGRPRDRGLSSDRARRYQSFDQWPER